MRSMRPWSRAFAWFAVVTAGLLMTLGIINLFINTTKVESWLPLLVLMALPLHVGIWSLQNQARR